jgi:type I restriction enzyme S subunit
MAAEWQQRQVSELIGDGKLLVGDGYRAKNEELAVSGLPFARAGNIKDGFQFIEADHFPEDGIARVGNKLSQPGDVVFTSKGTVGRFAFVRPGTPRFVYSPQLCFWRSLDPSLIEPRFLFYWMLGREFFIQFKGVAGQTDMAEYVSLTDQRRMHITLPPLSEQHAIAQILGTLDDKIELNRGMNETLDAMARAVFKSWFVDFDPVRARTEGRDTGLPRSVTDLFPVRFGDSDLGDIPVGWSTGTLLHQAKLLSGGTPKTDVPAYWDGGIPWASAKDVSQCGAVFLVATERTITATGLAESATQLVPALSTVIVARGATTGRMVLLGRDMAMNQTCYALQSTTDTPYALHCRLVEEIDALVHAAHGSVFDTITTKTIAASNVVVAPPPVLAAFEERVTPTFQRILKNVEGSGTLAALRDTLLPKLISGELRVKDAERFIGTAI